MREKHGERVSSEQIKFICINFKIHTYDKLMQHEMFCHRCSSSVSKWCWQGLRFKCHSTINPHIKMFCFDRKQNRWGFSHGQFNKCNCFVNVFIMVLVIHWCQCAFCTQYCPLSTLINCKLCAKKYGLCDYEQHNYTYVKRFKHVTDV